MEAKKIRALLVIPYSKEFHRIRRFLAESLEEIGVEPILIEETPIHGEITEAVLREIERADFIIADVSGKNPNVMYEVGYAHALRKPLLLTIRSKDSIPLDLKGFLFFVYHPSELEMLKRHIQRWVSHLIEIM